MEEDGLMEDEEEDVEDELSSGADTPEVGFNHSLLPSKSSNTSSEVCSDGKICVSFVIKHKHCGSQRLCTAKCLHMS